MNFTPNRKIQPDIKPVKSVDLTMTEKYRLENGFQVFTLNLGTQDLVKIEWVFEAGLAYQTKILLASFTNKMLSEGTTSYSAFEIAEVFDRYGAYLSTNIDKDFAYVAVYCLTKYLDHILPVLTEIISAPIFPENELQTLLNKSKQEFQINLKKVKSLAQISYPPLIFGNEHPYGQKAEVEDFDKLNRNDLLSFYENFYLSEQSKIFVSGKTDQQILRKINHAFERIETHQKHQLAEPDFSVDFSSRKHHKIKIDDALQSAIFVGKKMFNKHHPDFIGMQVLSTILGGYFGSRLMSNIREEKGFTYGIGSSLYSYKHDGLFSIQTEVGSDHTDATLTEIYHEIELLQNHLVGNEELSLIKNYLTGQLIRGLDGPFAVHDKLKAAVLFGNDLSYYQEFIETVISITPETLKKLAIKHLQQNSLIELIVGK